MKTPGASTRHTLIILALLLLGVVVLQVRFPEEVAEGLGGVRSGISDIWFRPYFHLGDQPFTLNFLAKSILFFVLLIFGARFVSEFVRDRVLAIFTLDTSQRFVLERVVRYSILALGMLVGIQSVLQINLGSLAFLGGAVGLGLGFGLQAIASNFVSGLILLFERPIKVGDRIEVDGLSGDVINIAARSTWIRTNDNVVIVVPNQDFITNRVINWTANDRRVRIRIPVGVSYSSDPATVRRLLLEVARENADVLPSPEPDVLFLAFGESSLDFELRVWTMTRVTTPHVLRSDLYFKIFTIFQENSIEIPFPQRDLHVRSIAAGLPVELPESLLSRAVPPPPQPAPGQENSPPQ